MAFVSRFVFDRLHAALVVGYLKNLRALDVLWRRLRELPSGRRIALSLIEACNRISIANWVSYYLFVPPLGPSLPHISAFKSWLLEVRPHTNAHI